MDLALLHTLNGFAFDHHSVEVSLTVYEGVAPILFAAILALLVLWPSSGGALRRAAVAAGLAAGVALACAQVIARVADRPRPFVADPAGVHVFAVHAADAGFPSDHATAAFAVAVALLLRDRRWGVGVLALATLLAVGRVALGLHYPTDELAGAVLGGGVSALLYVPALRRPIDGLADWVPLAS